MSVDFDWKWNDPTHFEAHRKEFARPVEEVLEELRPRLFELGERVREILAAPSPEAAGAGGSGPSTRESAGRASTAADPSPEAGASDRSGSAAEARRHWVHEEWELSAPTGYSGLRGVSPGNAAGEGDSFWAYRAGRRIPSHLCLGERELTSWVCLWGWVEPGVFVIHTIYPGRKAPREIHDPELALSQLSEAIEFWRTHAIVTEEGAFSVEPASE